MNKIIKEIYNNFEIEIRKHLKIRKNIYLVTIWFVLLLLVVKLTSASDEEIINQVKENYNKARREHYKDDTEKVKELELEINKLSSEKLIRKACLDYNYAHYNTIISPIDCEETYKRENEIEENWDYNSAWQSQSFIPLLADEKKERINQLLLAFWRGEDVLANRWERVGKKYWIKEEVLVCIAKADSSLWKALKTKNNFWNVWNNDRWDKVHFNSPIEWIEAIAKTLNNKYLGKYTTINDLSRYWNKDWAIYASSDENWHINVTNCLSSLYGEKIRWDYEFRL